ncbi:MAG TPA: hypothetical protein GXX29_10210 [Firmicutes bacterium]|nr:hypothetical protein [Bacillota bacterium]
MVAGKPQYEDAPGDAVRQFITEYFRALGAGMGTEGQLLRVELTAEQLSVLEGRQPLHPAFQPPDQSGLTVIYLAFTEEAAQEDKRAELVCKGSYRLTQMLSSARRLGRFSRFTVCPAGCNASGDEVYKPYLLLHMVVTCEGRNGDERLYALGIDLTGGAICPGLAALLDSRTLVETPPRHCLPRQVDLEEAMDKACRYIAAVMAKEDDGWARESLLALEAERFLLHSYYAKNKIQMADHTGSDDHAGSDDHEGGDGHEGGESDDDSHDGGYRRRLMELEKLYRPRAVARPALCALVFVPVGDLQAGDLLPQANF